MEVDPLSEATPEKVKSFVDSIKTGQFHNQLVQGAESTLSAILGRQSSYDGKEMTWNQLLKIEPELEVGSEPGEVHLIFTWEFWHLRAAKSKNRERSFPKDSIFCILVIYSPGQKPLPVESLVYPLGIRH